MVNSAWKAALPIPTTTSANAYTKGYARLDVIRFCGWELRAERSFRATATTASATTTNAREDNAFAGWRGGVDLMASQKHDDGIHDAGLIISPLAEPEFS